MIGAYDYDRCFETDVGCCKKRLSAPRCVSDKNAERVISVGKNQIRLLSCSNIIAHIQTAHEEGYFCECRMHLPIRDYVYGFVDDYFSCYCPDPAMADEDKRIILNSIADPNRFSKFTAIGHQSAYVETPYVRYIQSNCGEEIGLDLALAGQDQKSRIKYFVERFAWPQLTAYHVNSCVGMRKYHSCTTSKLHATEAVAHLIGLGNMIPHSEYIKLNVENTEVIRLFGSFMKKADGVCAMDIPPALRRGIITSEFQRAMSNLNLLDVICHEQDHSPNNYNVVMDRYGMAVGLSVFDNNGMGTFSLNSRIDFETFKRCSPILNADGMINRPCLDRAVAEKIMKLSRREVYAALSPFLKMPAIACTWRRITALKQAICRSVGRNPNFLLTGEEFSEETLGDELSGVYGKTYLLSFLQDCLHRVSRDM